MSPSDPRLPQLDSGFPSGPNGPGGADPGSRPSLIHQGAPTGFNPAGPDAKPRIQHTTATAIGGRREWKRKPNTDGTGATHCKTFHARLNSEAMELLDAQVNAWLDEHPELEVKLVTTAIGEWQGKVKEPNLIVQVWV